MKKNLFLLGTLLLGATMFVSCGSDGDDNPTPAPKPQTLEGTFFTVDGNSNFSNSGLPGATTEATLGTVTMNTTATNGGMNMINVQAPQRMRQFHVGIQGVDGHITMDADQFLATSDAKFRTLRTTEVEVYTYNIPVLYSNDLPHNNFNIMICGETTDGGITPAVTQAVTYLETLSGDLKVTLTFYAEKDVDLHVYTPQYNPEGGSDYGHIYYGNTTGGFVPYEDKYDESDEPIYEPTGNPTQIVGLDVDSNAGCSIDHIKIENIFIPAAYLAAGEYTVVVDMYSNCTPWDTPTKWSCVAYYQGNLITPTFGENPVYGEYAADAPDDDMTVVMKFNITDAQATKARGGAPLLTLPSVRPSFQARAKKLERDDF